MSEKYIVVWVSEHTESQGHGSPVEKHVAEEAAELGNLRYPYIRHEIIKESEFNITKNNQ